METGQIAFAKKVKDEIAKQEYDPEAMKYILSGFVRNNGSFKLGTNPSLTLHTEVSSIARLMFNAFQKVYDLKATISYERVARFHKNLVYLVTVEDPRLYEVMEDLEIFADGGFSRIPPKEGLKLKNLRYLVIGSFLSNGSVNNPRNMKSSYFLEMAFTDKKDAMSILRRLLTFKNEKTMDFKYIKRREKHVLYLKKSAQIPVFLSYLNAVEAMMDYENARIERDVVNTDNRWNICDTANYNKTTETAKKDIDMINDLLTMKPLSLFDKKTQAVIKARVNNPDFNYREMAGYILENYQISISKSGIAHIIIKMRETYEELKK